MDERHALRTINGELVAVYPDLRTALTAQLEELDGGRLLIIEPYVSSAA